MTDTDQRLRQDREREIAASCRIIAALWHDAQTIAAKQARKPSDSAPTTGHRTDTPPDPIDLAATQTLQNITQWLWVAASAAGRKYADAVACDPARNARYVSTHAHALAVLTDAGRWADECLSATTLVRQICGDNPHDPTRWRGALVPWHPRMIAGMLTDLTGRPVRENRLSLAAHRGKIHPSNGCVILGEAASAIGI